MKQNANEKEFFKNFGRTDDGHFLIKRLYIKNGSKHDE